jgi:hypothetical protein
MTEAGGDGRRESAACAVRRGGFDSFGAEGLELSTIVQ